MAYLPWREASEGLVGWSAMATKQSQPARDGEELYSNVLLRMGGFTGGGGGTAKMLKNRKDKKKKVLGAGLASLG